MEAEQCVPATPKRATSTVPFVVVPGVVGGRRAGGTETGLDDDIERIPCEDGGIFYQCVSKSTGAGRLVSEKLKALVGYLWRRFYRHPEIVEGLLVPFIMGHKWHEFHAKRVADAAAGLRAPPLPRLEPPTYPLPSSGAMATSKRNVEWLVCNLSKERELVFMHVTPDGVDTMVDVFRRYDDMTRLWMREGFSPFRREAIDSSGERREVRIYFDDAWGDTHFTTPAQIHFLMWAYWYGILEHAALNADEILASKRAVKATTERRRAEARKSGMKFKRQKLTRASRSACRVYRR